MKKFLLSFILSFSAFGYPFLQEEIPDINTQIRMYRNIYSAYKRPDFNPKEEPIPELAPMISMAYAHTANGLKPEDEKGHTLLNQFWQETAQAIKANQLFISFFKKTIFRLSLLLSRHQELPKTLEHISLLRTSYTAAQQDIWFLPDNPHPKSKAISGYELLEVQPYPFCFEAALFQKGGHLPISTQLENILENDLMLKLTLFFYEGQFSSSNDVTDSCTAYFTNALFEYSFWFNVYELSYDKWQNIKKDFRTIRMQAKNTQLVNGALYLLLRNIPLNLEYALEKESLSGRNLIKRWIDLQCKEATDDLQEDPVHEIDNHLSDHDLSTLFALHASPSQTSERECMINAYCHTPELGQVDLLEYKLPFTIEAADGNVNKVVLSKPQLIKDFSQSLPKDFEPPISLTAIKKHIEKIIEEATIVYENPARIHKSKFEKFGKIMNAILGYEKVSPSATTWVTIEALKDFYTQAFKELNF